MEILRALEAAFLRARNSLVVYPFLMALVKILQGLEAAFLWARNSLDVYLFLMALIFAVAGGSIYGLEYLSCSLEGSMGCHAYALRKTAAMLCAIVLPLKVSPWLRRRTAHIQAKTLRFWSRVLTTAYLVIPFVMAAVRSTSIGNMRGYQIFTEFAVNSIYDPRMIVITLLLLYPYAMP